RTESSAFVGLWEIMVYLDETAAAVLETDALKKCRAGKRTRKELAEKSLPMLYCINPVARSRRDAIAQPQRGVRPACRACWKTGCNAGTSRCSSLMRLAGSGWVDSHCGERLPLAAIMFCHR